ncbi:MAG: response regulator [Gammaproteobacteria bacterium]
MEARQEVSAVQILVVDDNKTVRENAQLLLDQRLYHVRVAENGFDALCKLVAFPPDIVFMDIGMPELDGLQSCALITANPQYAHIPVVLMSANGGPLEQARAELAGASELIPKPLRKQDLLNSIQTLLRFDDASQYAHASAC